MGYWVKSRLSHKIIFKFWFVYLLVTVLILLMLLTSCLPSTESEPNGNVTFVVITNTPHQELTNTPVPLETNSLTPSKSPVPTTTPSQEPTSTYLPSETATQPPPPTRTFTPSPSPTITPTSTSELEDTFNFSFIEIAFYAPPFGFGLSCAEQPEGQTSEPAVFFSRYREERSRSVVFCIVNFNENQLVELSILSPDKKLAARFSGIPTRKIDGNVTLEFTLPSFPLSLPNGTWYLEARSKQKVATNTFHHPANRTYVTTSKETSGAIGVLHPLRFSKFKSDEIVSIDGIGYPPDITIPVGIYRIKNAADIPITLEPVDGYFVQTDEKGNLHSEFKIPSDLPPGVYSVIPFPDLDQSEFQPDQVAQFEVYKTWKPCSGALPSNITQKSMAMLVPGLPNNVRTNAGLGSKLIGKLPEYSIFFIEDGPKCKNGMVWWKISASNLDLEGWTAEGAEGDAWMVPLN